MATRRSAAKAKTLKQSVAHRKHVNVVPDRLDLRDRMYQPPVNRAPKKELPPDLTIPVLDQGETSACTGFALASVIYKLQAAARREAKTQRVAGFMLYNMARRYDEFPGAPDVDTGSSLRGAMKAWYKHGACAEHLWQTGLKMPPPPKNPAADWWRDAVKRPLGAYYRIETRSVTEMQIALNETGILYASAVCHEKWDDGYTAEKVARGDFWKVPAKKATQDDGGHAFAIVGYTRDGFIIQNSWTTGWARAGARC